MKRTIFLIFTLFMLAASYTPNYGMWARGRQAFARLGMPVASNIRNYFYGAVGMRNPETKKTAIFLADVHLSSQFGKMRELQQQQELIACIKELQKQGKSVHVLVEDMAAFLKDKGYQNFEKVLLSSSLNFFTNVCKKNDIACTNIECRDVGELQKLQALTPELQKIKKNIDPELFKCLDFYYSLHRKSNVQYRDEYIKYNLSNQGEFVDAYALQAMSKNKASVYMFLTGGYHTASLTKKFYIDDYKQTHVMMPDGLILSRKSYISDFDKDKPIPLSTGPLPPHLLNIDKEILNAVKKLDTDTKRATRKK